ncbi:hypothetical protein PICMEDRAFT_122937 [Pichia membranifaciens NRRL Y-2026]|uniref:Trafficking protein particle complex subunit n=1 Tax=Pichia membranifaciens NRRL Y-2026 TaxID=763406 RepID=A0A1E3NPN2_9ASCO|nr:hypothetical protein PICMEDRAFT_122937 [Pichia membranifaciens NRRL Y-2026]ODQ48081.1 hypothetical protein PICMEDRAFT_122937 [Pichia membranifaciens NRRL Y-2026]
MKIKFVSLISRDNRPLYIQSFVSTQNEKSPSSDATTPEEMNELLKYNFLSHMSLDVFESPFAPIGTHSAKGKPTLLFVQDGVLVYGSETLTGLKVVVGCSRYNREAEKGTGKEPEAEEGSTTVAAKVSSEKSLGNLDGFVDTDVIELSDLDSVTTAIRKEYLRYSCNPFLDPKEETEINSEKFDRQIKRIVDGFNSESV